MLDKLISYNGLTSTNRAIATIASIIFIKELLHVEIKAIAELYYYSNNRI